MMYIDPRGLDLPGMGTELNNADNVNPYADLGAFVNGGYKNRNATNDLQNRQKQYFRHGLQAVQEGQEAVNIGLLQRLRNFIFGVPEKPSADPEKPNYPRCE